MKAYYWFVVFAVLFSSCSETPKNETLIGPCFSDDGTEDWDQPKETVVDKRNSYANAEKLSVEEAKTLFVKMSQNAYINIHGGGSGTSGYGSSDPYANMKAVDKTTEDIWEKFKVQVFNFDNKTYFVRDKIYVHAYNSAITSYCIVDMNSNNVPELVFVGVVGIPGSGSAYVYYYANIFTEDPEIYKLAESQNVFANIQVRDVEKVDELTIKLKGKKSYLLSCDYINKDAKLILVEEDTTQGDGE